MSKYDAKNAVKYATLICLRDGLPFAKTANALAGEMPAYCPDIGTEKASDAIHADPRRISNAIEYQAFERSE